MRYAYRYIVHPDDAEIPPRSFRDKHSAEEWAAGLCCAYWIEAVSFIAGR